MILRADARHIPLADASVQCVVTSPPYWGLRDYRTGTWSGGDDATCDHIERAPLDPVVSKKQLTNKGSIDLMYRDVCKRCGATRADLQIGREETPHAFVDAIVGVFREVRRVLRDDGVAWLNLGDSYMASGNDVAACGVKPKDLVGIPWRVALALQNDGWYLRSDIIWHKPNPMPESVLDRPTKAHEYVFMLSKRERYFYDARAISTRALNAGKVTQLGEKGLSRGQAIGANVKPSGNGLKSSVVIAERTNARTVWTIATESYSEAHFATFPRALVRRCIKASTRVGDLVLDPFGGSGTTVQVALSLGCRGVCLDINPAYNAMAEQRVAQRFLWEVADMEDRRADDEHDHDDDTSQFSLAEADGWIE